MANVEFGTGKTVLILTIVAACFAILWPKVFYPMLLASPGGKPQQADNLNGCCDVIFETDVNAIKIMTEICGTIINRDSDFNPKLVQVFNSGKLTKEIIDTCRNEVIRVCGTDIAEFLKGQIKIGRTYRQILDEIRSFNTSLCLRQNFGINPGLFGAPRLVKILQETASTHLRQERPPHLRPEMLHPALREKGRAIPPSHVVPKVLPDKEQQAPNRALPMPGMRPPMGGPGHVVPAPKGGGTMSIVMPLYTIGIVIFFMYTIMKVFIKKSGSGTDFKDFRPDPEFRQTVFEDYSNGCAPAAQEAAHFKEHAHLWKTPSDDNTRLVLTAIGGLLAEVDQQLEGTQTQYSTESQTAKADKNGVCTEKKERTQKVFEQEVVSRELLWDETTDKGDIVHEPVGVDVAADDSNPKIKVLGLETVAGAEGGARWSRPVTPLLGDGGHSRSITPIPPPMSPEPHNIFLEGTLPSQSKLLVTDSETQALTLQLEGEGEAEPPVILSGKMTLSVISLDKQTPVHNVETFDDADSTLFDDADSTLFDDADSTLFEIDRNVIEDTRQETDQEVVDKNESQLEEETHYTTATMSAGDDETAADVSNLDNLDTAEDQEEIEEEEAEIWNENALPNDLYQHQR